MKESKDLKALIYHSINQLFYDGRDDIDDENIPIEHIGNQFHIAFAEDHGQCFAYTVEATSKAVASFLDELGELRARLTKEHRSIDEKVSEITKP
ncbi:hypothetical protein [Noviherbaspirillum pedocola]|uniref:Uncharacterized protein n=1 Tax=Noviherbaspirillum pedocola TaxID=2801341 RepID=A0A934W4B1_9BURK|nr:hypothetical protein [Noviherbaspirillum pedocola]MBK4733692.1 hypothetical protein [Noviherbaspirillum pedocola]